MSDASSTGPSSAPDDSWWTDEPNPTPDKAPPHTRDRRRWMIAAAVVIVAAAVGGVALAHRSKHATTVGSTTSNASSNGASAGQFGRRRPGTRGTITSISGSNLTVTTSAKASVKVLATSNTVVTNTSTGTLADLKPGDRVRVVGTTATSGPITARAVIDTRGVADQFGGRGAGRPRIAGGNGRGGQFGPRNGNSPGGPVAAGTVTSVNGSVIHVKTAAGPSVAVTTTSSTTVVVTTKIALSDLAKGDTVTVTGATANGTLTATAIRRGDLGAGFGFGGPGGPPGNGTGTPAATP